MMHRFEVEAGAPEGLLLVYPPEAILALARELESFERAHGPLPATMQTPIRGHLAAIVPGESTPTTTRQSPPRS